MFTWNSLAIECQSVTPIETSPLIYHVNQLNGFGTNEILVPIWVNYVIMKLIHANGQPNSSRLV